MSAIPDDLIDVVCKAADEEAADADERASFPVGALAALRETRLLGALVPAEHGGPGATMSDVVDVTMRLARADMSVALIYAMHCQQTLTLVHHAGDELAREVLPALARGDLYLGSVTTEPGATASLFVAESRAHAEQGRTLIDRMAPIVTGGTHADGYLITMRTPDAGSPSQVDLLYAGRDELTVEVKGGWNPLGMRATESVPMAFRGAVPASHTVGEPGCFADIAKATFIPAAHTGWAAAWLGAAAGALSRVAKHLRGGKQAPSELVLARLGDIRTELDCVHAMLRHAVAEFSPGDTSATGSFQALVNSLKITAAVRCYAAVDAMVDLVGLRHGYLLGSPLRLDRTLRDLRSASLNYANDKLRLANGALALMDTGTRLA